MGLFQSRQDHGVEDIEIPVPRTYGYPAKCGNYFSSHFIMGGEKFETVNPECFLFGENNDLNYLCNKPAQFPYPQPTGTEPSRTLRCLVHLRKDTLRLVRISEKKPSQVDCYNIEFTFDTDVACAVRIYLLATENLAGGIARYTSRNKQSEPVFYQRGSNQTYCNRMFNIVPSSLNEEEFQYQPGGTQGEAMAIPIVIQITVEEEDFPSQCEVTFATFEKNSDSTYSIKFLKQKIVADGVCYIIQEIYGIENKKEGSKDKDDDLDENGTECVICMCDTRDTLILPCRHLCLCNGCANSLRYQASNCPICRSPFHALLQIKAVRRKIPAAGIADASAAAKEGSQESDDYEEVPLVDALNGYLPADGASGYSSRQSSARRSKSRNGSRPNSRKSRSGSRNGSRSSAVLPPVDKVDHPVNFRPYSGTERLVSVPKSMAVQQVSDAEDAAAAASFETSSMEPILPDAKDEQEEAGQVDLQDSLQSTILKGMIRDESELETVKRDDTVAELPPNMDLSLPGTPMGSDVSNQSASSINTQRTTSTTAGSSSSIYITQAQVSTPSNVNIEEAEG
ncbi:probable E3 ubiquitin-protein ligase MGRN1 [Rhopilema esculentum]|uniref:probable E3 ubiquitin-protein ligase MGRN1 n=1 Tax=Rhopilema esculentum TaxID=499914 RepID=UPI0031E31A91